MASSCTREVQIKFQEEFLCEMGGQALKWAAQGSDEVPGSI